MFKADDQLTMGIRLSYALAVPPPDLSDVTVYSSVSWAEIATLSWVSNLSRMW